MTKTDFFINCLSERELRWFAEEEVIEIPQDTEIKSYLKEELKSCDYINFKEVFTMILAPKSREKLKQLIKNQELTIKVSKSKTDQDLRNSIIAQFDIVPFTAEEISEQEEEQEEAEALKKIQKLVTGESTISKTDKKDTSYNPYFFYATIFQRYNRDYFIISKKGSKKPKTANNDTIILFQHLVALGKHWKKEQGLDEFFHSSKQIEESCNIGVNAQKTILPFLEQKKIISRRWSQKENKMWFKIHFNEIIKQADKIFKVDKEELKEVETFFMVQRLVKTSKRKGAKFK